MVWPPPVPAPPTWATTGPILGSSARSRGRGGTNPGAGAGWPAPPGPGAVAAPPALGCARRRRPRSGHQPQPPSASRSCSAAGRGAGRGSLGFSRTWCWGSILGVAIVPPSLERPPKDDPVAVVSTGCPTPSFSTTSVDANHSPRTPTLADTATGFILVVALDHVNANRPRARLDAGMRERCDPHRAETQREARVVATSSDRTEFAVLPPARIPDRATTA